MPRCGEADGAWLARWRMQYHSDGWYRRGGRGKEEASDERDERRRRPKSIIGLTRHLTIMRRPLSPIALRCSLAVLLSLRQIVIPRRIESCSTSMAPSATHLKRERERESRLCSTVPLRPINNTNSNISPPPPPYLRQRWSCATNVHEINTTTPTLVATPVDAPPTFLDAERSAPPKPSPNEREIQYKREIEIEREEQTNYTTHTEID